MLLGAKPFINPKPNLVMSSWFRSTIGRNASTFNHRRQPRDSPGSILKLMSRIKHLSWFRMKVWGLGLSVWGSGVELCWFCFPGLGFQAWGLVLSAPKHRFPTSVLEAGISAAEIWGSLGPGRERASCHRECRCPRALDRVGSKSPE